MLWVGGHILLVGAHELGWHAPYDLVHDVEHWVEDVPGIGGLLAWTLNTAISAVVGLAVGAIVVAVVSRVRRRGNGHAAAAGAH
jgi:predicted DNA repair protein MutK